MPKAADMSLVVCCLEMFGVYSFPIPSSVHTQRCPVIPTEAIYALLEEFILAQCQGWVTACWALVALPNIFQPEPFFMGFTKYIMDSKTKVTRIGYSWKNHHGRVCFFSISSTAAKTGPHLGHHSLSRRSLHGLWSIWSWGTSHRVALKMAESGPTTSHNSQTHWQEMMHRTFHLCLGKLG